MSSGIYKITNLKNGKFYVGSSNDIDNRWICHRRDLTNGDHVNPKLQHAWDFYGKDTFKFEIVEEVDPNPELLFERENHYLSTLKPYERKVGYNICPKAEGGDNFTHNPRKEEIRAYWLIHNKGEGNPMFGKNHTEKTIDIQKEKSIGRYTLEWFIERYGNDGQKKFQERPTLGSPSTSSFIARNIGCPALPEAAFSTRSEERRVGKECRSRWSPYH